MSLDVMDLLARENPVPVTMPPVPIEAVLRRLNNDAPASPKRPGAARILRRRVIPSLPFVLSALVAFAVAAVVIATVHHKRPAPRTGNTRPAARAGLAPGLRQHFALFRNTKPTPVRDVAAIDLSAVKFMSNFGHLGLDESEMREVSYGATKGRILVIPGSRGVCVKRAFPPAIDLDGGGGGCGYLSTVLSQGIMGIADGATLQGLVPDGNRTVSVHFGSRRTVTVPVRDNTVLAVFTTSPEFVNWRTAAGKRVRWPGRS